MAIVEDGNPILESQSPFFLQWRSTRPGRVSWTKDDVVSLATSMKNNLPVEVVSVISDPNYKGGALINLKNPMARPSANELAKNHIWLLPFVKDSPSKVPSGYYMCDAFLMLDFLLGKKLFRPKPGVETRAGLASEEAVKAKRCLGSLRYLWRNSTSSHDPYILEMKSFLQASPLQGERRRRRRRAAEDEEEEESEALQDESDGEGEEAEPLQNEPAGDCHDGSDNESTGTPCDSPPAAEGQDSPVSLTASTRRLGDSPPSEKEEVDLRDSQVSSGWLGKFYAAYGGNNPRCKLPDPELDGESIKSVEDDAMPDLQGDMLPIREILDVIQASLSSNGLFGEHPMMPDYLDYCDKALTKHGSCVGDTLASRQHFHEWIYTQKAEDSPSPSAPAECKPKKESGGAAISEAFKLMNMDARKATELDGEHIITPATKKPRLTDSVEMNLSITPPPPVERQSVKAMAKIKKESKAAPSQTCSGERTTRFRDYNLEGLPHEALPFKGMDYKGKHSYTVALGDAALEVLCKVQAYVVKRPRDGTERPGVAQVLWKRHGGPIKAWDEAKSRAGL